MSVTNKISEPQSEAGLQRLHSAVVEAVHIDQLGHMNVRIYGTLALRGIGALAGRLGLRDLDRGGGGVRLGFTDLYTRHFREQLEGAALEVWGGVLEVRGSELRIYSELVNPARKELAATFVHVMRLEDRATHAPVPLAPDVQKSAEDAVVAWPDRGRPRSVDLDREPPSMPLAKARALGLETRKPRVIGEDECDSDGFYRTDAFLELVWGGERIDRPDDVEWIRDLGDGRRMGWATMESRGTLAELPRAGMRIQSFGAVVELGRKSLYERNWVYDIERETRLCTASDVSIAFDIGERKAIEIPADERSRLERQLHPDLR